MAMKILQGDAERRLGIYYEYDPYSRPLGEGGMGIVFKGFRVNAASKVRQVVAIKAMKVGLPQIVYEKAEREANIRLRNDNLVEMMGFIVTSEQEVGGRIANHYYVVSEFINGVVLSDLLKGNFKDRDGIEIPFAKKIYLEYVADRETVAVRIIKRVLAGIMALHDKGYIHRDIDPSNIMITKEGSLKIIDFGIAKNVRGLTAHDRLMTAAGEFVGKVEYASPELIIGAVNDQDFSTDIYEVGILFYQLLVGKLPFEGPRYDIMKAQQNKNVPVGNIPFRKYRPIVKKATQKKQADRYQSCSEIRFAIDNAKDPLPVWIKVACGLALVGGLSSGAYWAVSGIIDPDQNPDPGLLPPTPQYVDTRDADFKNALALLNSIDKDSVNKGWEQMKDLADNQNYAKARMEVGLTYFIDEKVEIASVSKRRSKLNLGTESKKESLKNLTSVKDSGWISGEALAALGILKFRYELNQEEADRLLQKAIKDIDKNKDRDLYDKVDYYLKQFKSKQ